MGQEGITEVYLSDDETLTFLRKERKRREAEVRARAEEKATTPTRTMGEPIVAYEKGMPNIIHGNKKPKKKTLQEVWDEEDQAKREREE